MHLLHPFSSLLRLASAFKFHTSLFKFLLPLLCSLQFAAAATLPTAGESLLSEDALSRPWAFYPGKNQGQPVAQAKLVSAQHPAFRQAMRVQVLRPDGKFYNGAIQLPSKQAVHAGDTVLTRLHFRSVHNTEETGNGFATVFLQGPPPGYKKYLIREVSAGHDWQTYSLPVKLTDDLAPEQLSLFIGAGGGSKPQTWEVGGIELINYGSSVELSDLPQSQATYIGRAPDAPWRTAANERIERYRKGDICIQVFDTDGNPIHGAAIELRQQRHAYHFGSVITAALITGESQDAEIYRQKVLELFNQSGTENDLKWGPWQNEWGQRYNRAQTLEALQWLRDHHFYTRGHVLVWPGKKHLPRNIQAYLQQDQLQRTDPIVKEITLAHIEDITSATAHLLDEWDVVNEPYSNHDLMDAFGDTLLVDWFKAARQHLPTQQLYLNDYGILSGNGRDLAHHQHYEQTLRTLIDAGAPITGMGMQGHFGATPTAINKVYQIIDQFHKRFPQLNIRITEFDIQSDDPQLQADYTRDLLTIAFSHPATVGLQCWGFWAGAHWRPESAMYTKDWQEKPNAREWKRLTRELWWTKLDGQSNRDGVFAARGFYGDYTVKVSHQGRSQTVHFSLSQDSKNELVIQF
ncbi:endo-1,4-beta-xylanase [Coraliomargarita sp. SDUM461003]|uniref:Beta-xylanase n=1 Tax=Thalassobacterium maritimum TaxID=3041265 RepID=A0ABU1B1A8_9BACT|nr:endo-1,4-beta-xylanase [Coraliomargarita sp. SDUM461003]MDQ8209390.1 endo-1,4-beta-xylanase [Coraliomargarita sp. SDUM461003]